MIRESSWVRLTNRIILEVFRRMVEKGMTKEVNGELGLRNLLGLLESKWITKYAEVHGRIYDKTNLQVKLLWRVESCVSASVKKKKHYER